MIETILQPFDFILQMPIEQQCEFSIGLSFAGFCFAALLRESCKDHHIRYVARALGAAAFFAVSAFAVHATQQVEQLEQELFVKEGKKISVEHAVTLTSKQGHKISVGNESNGVRRIAAECLERSGRIRQRSDSSISSRGGIAASSMGDWSGIGDGDGGLLAAPRVPEWIRSAYGAARDAAGIEQPGKAEGKDF